MSAAPLLMQSVSWWFRRGTNVLDGVDLDVRNGECVVVRGANGSGKTTLARIAAGALVARRGTVHRAARVAYVPQATDSPPVRLRADRYLDALARMRGDAGSRDAVDALGIRTVIGRPINELSTGTIVKVLVAGAVAGAPELLVCDEPFADLDETGRGVVRELVTRLRAGGCGVLLTDHSDASHAFADRELRVEDGRLT